MKAETRNTCGQLHYLMGYALINGLLQNYRQSRTLQIIRMQTRETRMFKGISGTVLREHTGELNQRKKGRIHRKGYKRVHLHVKWDQSVYLFG